METESCHCPPDNNNQFSEQEVKLLATMEAANRMIESDTKSLNSLSNVSELSRLSSDSSNSTACGGGAGGCNAAGDDDAAPEQEAWLRWGRLVNEWDTHWKKKNAEVKEMVRRGIPHHFRGIVWQLLCKAHNSPDKTKYAHYIKATSACEKSIRRDIARTYPEHEFFKEKDGMGQESLFNVMKAYSLHDREVGYCQGTAFIVGLLLMQMPEEESFAVLVRLMEDYRMREMFKPSMAELGVCLHQLEALVQEQVPELHAHFRSQSFHASMYASSWLLTVFTTSLSLAAAERVMDWFLADGVEVVFRLSLAILIVGQADLLSLDMEGMLRYFQKDMPVKFDGELERHFALAQSVKYSARRMKKLEKEYVAMKTKEHEDQVELRRLRTENRLLRQQVDYLEGECASLAARLVRGQVSCAEEAEHSFVVRRELEAVRHHSLATRDQLEAARLRIQALCHQMSSESGVGEDSEQSALSLKSELSQRKDELIDCLQEQLVDVRLHQAEGEASIKQLQHQCNSLQQEVESASADSEKERFESMEQQLSAAAERESNSLKALQQLQQAVSDLNVMWKRHLEEKEKLKLRLEEWDGVAGGGGGSHNAPSTSQPRCAGAGDFSSCAAGSGGEAVTRTPTAARRLLSWASGGGGGGAAGAGEDAGRLRDQLMTSRLAEIQAKAEVDRLSARLDQQDTSLQVATSQLRRQSDQLKQAEQRLVAAEAGSRQRADEAHEWQRRFADLQGKMKEELMVARIRDAEHTQYMAELTQKLCYLELKNQELLAESELNGDCKDNVKARELCDKVAELKAQVMYVRHSVSSGRSSSNSSSSDSTMPSLSIDGQNGVLRAASVESDQEACSIQSTSADIFVTP